MAAHESNIVAEGQELLLNRPDQRRMIPVWKIGSPNRPLKQHIAHESKAFRFTHEHDVARRVPRTMQYLECPASNHDGIALPQPTIRSNIAGAGEPKGPALIAQPA